MECAEPFIEWKFWASIIALEITVVKLMEKTAYKQARLVLCKDRFITGMTRRSAKKLPMQQKQDVHRMGRKHEENQKRAEIQEML